ncbi:esterase/lipase family protein [Ornithinibacillus salinisoli]|uniref:Esterase/lipase family protein n=1 Tax=Ornithinibacillus salinisoli TaxID=1848459 RepID=A0ABW4W1R7_9BACI
MQLRIKRLLIIGFIMVISFSLSYPVSAGSDLTDDIPTPTLVGDSNDYTIMGKVDNGNDETPGEWYIGAVPANPVPNSPVILFVPGLNNVAQIFWEDNDMYQTAVDAGYQTAFVQLHDAGGASADMWDNGQLLAEKISEISAHFGKPVTVVAYSKGGVDTQTALTYYGAWQYVDNVITLSSPHHGSQLADLAYSSWASWLADLIGAQGDGTYALQMANMEHFRSQIDNQSMAYYNDYYTLGGTNWGSVFSSTWYGGVYLSQYGSNDGVVTTSSSRLPGGQQLAIGDWNHTTIRTGATFPVFENYVMGNQQPSTTSMPNASEDVHSSAATQWVHGGSLVERENNEVTVFVEDGVQRIGLHVMTSDDLSEIRLIDPKGNLTTPKIDATKNKDGVFIGSTSYYLTIDKPIAGNWKVKMTPKEDGAYVLLADYTANPIVLRNEKSDSNDHLQVNYHLEVDQLQVQEKTLKATYRITESRNQENRKTYTVSGGTDLSKVLVFDQTNEVYNITIDIEGITKGGEAFKRTIIDSVYTD